MRRRVVSSFTFLSTQGRVIAICTGFLVILAGKQAVIIVGVIFIGLGLYGRDLALVTIRPRLLRGVHKLPVLLPFGRSELIVLVRWVTLGLNVGTFVNLSLAG